VRLVNRQRSLLAHAAARAHAPHSATGACPLTAELHCPLLSDSVYPAAAAVPLFAAVGLGGAAQERDAQAYARLLSPVRIALQCPCSDARAYAPHFPTRSASGRPDQRLHVFDPSIRTYSGGLAD
jgi:hypothetical protein